jgi:alpha-ketoglutarate-dependent taurine dioxygenase
MTETVASATLDNPALRQRRSSVLEEPKWFPCEEIRVEPTTVDELLADPAAARDRVEQTGLALYQLDRPLDVDRFVQLSRAFGDPEPETAASLMDRVQQQVVLNLKPDSTTELVEANRPFSAQPLTFHIEGSRRPLGTSPDYLLFQCVLASPLNRGNQTVLRSIEDTLDGLTERALRVLSATTLYPDSTDARVVHEFAGQRRLNFRDPAPSPFRWQSKYGDDQVVDAFTELLSVIYNPKAVLGIPWRDSLLSIIDNRRWMHARTRGRDDRRHMQRIRVQDYGKNSDSTRDRA